MKKTILLYLALVNLAFAYNYDDVLLKAQASIFPKIILLDKKIENKLIDGTIVYTIVYDKSDHQTALETRDFINKKYKGRLGKYVYKINLVEFSDLSESIPTSAVYVLNLGDRVAKIASIARAKGIISFAYDLDNLKKGLMFSLSIEKSTVLYLDKENLYTQDVDFVDSLLQMVRFIDNKSTIDRNSLFNNKSNPKLFFAQIMDNELNHKTDNLIPYEYNLITIKQTSSVF